MLPRLSPNVLATLRIWKTCAVRIAQSVPWKLPRRVVTIC